MRVVLLEDEPSQAALMTQWLEQADMTCIHYATGAAFRRSIAQDNADLIILDWMLPDDDGLAILQWLRNIRHNLSPIMFATTRAEEASLVAALEQGADDYLIKPLRQHEVIARVNALLRRSSTAKPAGLLTLGPVQIDIDNHSASINGALVSLTDRELDLAIYMIRNHGRLLTRQELLEQVWHTSANLVTRTVDTHVSRLRVKLGLTAENGFELSTVYHKGYRLEYRPAADTAQT